MRFTDFDENLFRNNVGKAIQHVDRILQVHRNPRLAENVDHEYTDKYHLADLMTNVGIISNVNCLQQLGLNANILKTIDKTKSTTLRFEASDTCEFFKETEVEIPMERTVETVEDTQTRSSSFFGSTSKATITRVVNRVKEYHWKVGIEWEISVFSGTNVNQKTVLQSKKSSTIIVIQSRKEPPFPKHRVRPAIDVSLTWLLQQIDTESLVAKFKIDRAHPNTKTPLRNNQMQDAGIFFKGIRDWGENVNRYFCRALQQEILNRHNPAAGPPSEKAADLAPTLSDGIFCPIVPLMEETQIKDANEVAEPTNEIINQLAMVALGHAAEEQNEREKSSPLFSNRDMTNIINEHIHSIEEKIQSLRKIFPVEHLPVKPISVAEAAVVAICGHLCVLCPAFLLSIGYIEWMLEQQLISAIGKRVSSSDMDKFVQYHNNKFLTPPPKPFCHSIRRPDHYPDGILTIEGSDPNDGSSKREPIDTFVREVGMPSPLKIPLNAAATLEMTGKVFLHGWLRHCFLDTRKQHELIARARQFSSFMLVVGTMVGSDRLEPKDAIILQNKDEVIIPLLLDELPSAKEFKDAIQSLSPEQQQFAKSFRNMQLESSVLGVCIVQIKPQLEELLGLPTDALTKEMKLTQDLMELFIEYQIPSDLLSYGGMERETAGVREKVETVKSHVKAVMDVVDAAKNRQLAEQTKKAEIAVVNAVSDYSFEVPDYCFASQSLDFSPPPPSASVAYSACFSPAPPTRRATRSLSRGSAPGLRQAYSSPPPPPRAPAAFAPPPPPPPGNAINIAPRSPAPSQQLLTPAGAFAAPPPVSRAGAVSRQTTPASQAAQAQETASVPTAALPETSSIFTNEPTSHKNEGVVDFTSMPKLLDTLVEKHDKEGSLRSTTIKTKNTWTRNRQKDLLSKMSAQTLGGDDTKSEKDKAFDLLDALSRSGSLPIACSELHVIICLTHRFEKDVMETVIQDNINPIEKIEMSTLLFASAIHGVSPKDLVREAQDVDRLAGSFPLLLG